MDSAVEDDIEQLKERLRSYNKEEIEFSRHSEDQLLLREGKKEEVIGLLLNPERLVYSYQEKGRHGSVIHYLHFRISNTRTIRLSAIFNKDNKALS